MKLFGKISMIFALFTIMTTIGCVKEGPAGPTGAAGSNGAPGATGTANVIYSDWFNFKTTDWKDTTILLVGTAYRAIKLAPS